MAVASQPTAVVTGPATQPGPSAPGLPGFDAGAMIAAQEQNLAEYLNRPVQEILAQLGYPPLPAAQPPGPLPPDGAVPPAAPGAGPIDPGQLIKPVTDALGTLGDGLFDGLDPTQMLQSISQAVEGSNANLTGALNSLAGNWEGAGGAAALAKTATALDNGAALNTQAAALRNSLTVAVATVKQAEARLIGIIDEFMATMAAIGPSIIFPWGWAAAIAAATQAVTLATETMTELQAKLATQAAEVTAAGQPVPMTESPATAMTTPAQLSSAAAPTSGASEGLSALMNTATKAAQAGTQTATDLASQLGGSGGAPGATTPMVSPVSSAVPTRAGGGGSAGGMGAGGATAGGGANTLAARSAPPMPPMSEDVGRTVASAPKAGIAPGGYGSPMMGAPMAPMAHGGRVAGGHHSAPAFLQTTDHGDEIVGDLGTAAPPVIGEA